MATRAIEIDLDAYELLTQHQRDGESLSDVIRVRLGAGYSVEHFRERLRSIQLSESALQAMERQVEARSLSPARAVTL